MTDRKLFNRHHKDAPAGAIYIGRGTIWGNTWEVGPDGTRDEVCDKFEAQVKEVYENNSVDKEALARLHGKAMVCSCYPKRCHGETLIKYAKLAYDELNQEAQNIVDF